MAMHKLLKRARKEGTPLIKGDQVTFVWYGEAAPQLLGDMNGWGYGAPPIELQQVASNVWAHTMTIDPAAYIEYAYFTDIDKGERAEDQFNRRRIDTGFGGYNNLFEMPNCQHTMLLRPRPGIARGTITRHTLENDLFLVGGKRDVWLYQPPTEQPAPLVVVFDGNDYMRRQNLTVIIDNLIAQGRIRPLALAMVGHGRQARIIEYAASEATVSWVTQDVVELAQKQLNLLDLAQHPGAFGLLGASMGGLMALYTALRKPQIFGHVLSQSGAFELEVMKQTPLIDLAVEHYAGERLNIWMDCGIYEYLLAANRKMYPKLREKGHRVTYREFAGGHNTICWRDDLAHGFETLFPLQEG